MSGDVPAASAAARALDRLRESAIDKYLWLQDNLATADFTVSSEYTMRFAAFYGLRRSKAPGGWQEIYFRYFKRLQSARTLPTFADALENLSQRLPPLREGSQRPIEASFTSKLLATIDPRRPVLDSEVLSHFNLSLPGAHVRERSARVRKVIETFGKLEGRLTDVLKSPKWSPLRTQFDRAFPGLRTSERITDMKALDLLIWASRGGVDKVVADQ